jgi:serine/threonine protein kinase
MKVCPQCGRTYGSSKERCPADGHDLETVEDPLLGKTVAGRYRLISRLGAGGMSMVYLARHVLIDRLVAVKTLRRDLSRDPIQRDRFIREARAVNRINHDNIVEITDFGETDDGLVYLVMEYVPGENLLDALADSPFAPGRALYIAEQIGGALGRAHQMGVVHRDLKPENVLLVPTRDSDEEVKILDFGIAKIMDAPSLTGSQQIFGTPGYIAPEYIQSTAIDGRADLYSLGVILYEMVTGALPFDYKYPGDLLVKHVTERPIPPTERHPAVEPAMEKLILQCLEKDPSDRFRDAYHFLEELAATRERLGGSESWGGLNEPPSREVDLAESSRRTLPAPPPPAVEAMVDGPATEPEEATDPDGFDVIPAPPAMTLPEVEKGAEGGERRDLGPLGIHRWRRRYEVLLAAVESIRATGSVPTGVSERMELARQTLVNLEDGLEAIQEAHLAIEGLEAEARDYRTTLGRAIDQLAQKLSKARGSFEDLVRRRERLRNQNDAQRRKLKDGTGDEGESDAVLWELATVEETLQKQASECDGVESQLQDLRLELERRNEAMEGRVAAEVVKVEQEMDRLEALSEAVRQPLAEVEAWVRECWLAAGG